MDIATIVGMLTGGALVLLAMAKPLYVLDVPSVLFVVGGTLALALISFPLQDFRYVFRYWGYTVIPPKPGADQSKVIGELEKGIVMFMRVKSYAQATGWVVCR